MVSWSFPVEIQFCVTRNCTVVLLVSIFEVQLREWYCKTDSLPGLHNSIPFFPKVQAVPILQSWLLIFGVILEGWQFKPLKHRHSWNTLLLKYEPWDSPHHPEILAAIKSDERTNWYSRCRFFTRDPSGTQIGSHYVIFFWTVVTDHALRRTMVSSSSVYGNAVFLIISLYILRYRSRDSLLEAEGSNFDDVMEEILQWLFSWGKKIS